MSRIKGIILEKCKTGNDSVAALVTSISSNSNYGKDDVVSAILKLEEERLITIRAKIPYKKFFLYGVSPLATWFWTTCLIVVISVLFSFMSTGIALFIRYSVGSLLVLFLPGYSLLALLYYNKNDINDLARYALSIATSLAVVPMIGVVLNYTPDGLTLTNIQLALGLFVVLTSACALWRKYSIYKLESLIRI